MRRILHALLVCIGNVPLLLAYLAIGAATLCYVAAARVWPGATRGNCWAYALARAWDAGGHVCVRPVRGARMCAGLGVALHAAWAPRLHGPVQQTDPVERYRGPSLLWRWAYFPYTVRGADSKPAQPWSSEWGGLS